MNKWGDFFFTLVVRFIGGVVLGVIASIVLWLPSYPHGVITRRDESCRYAACYLGCHRGYHLHVHNAELHVAVAEGR